MEDELESIWKEAAVSSSGYYPSIFLDGLRKVMETLDKIFGAPAGIRTYQFPNMILERHSYSSR